VKKRGGYLGTATEAFSSAAETNAIVVDPKPLFEISPWLYMQFMEPLGSTDGSVEACWDYEADDWRKDFVDTVRDLAPGAIRFGGLFSRYYKWREGDRPACTTTANAQLRLGRVGNQPRRHGGTG
jgi:hypothetical protein